MSREQRHAAQEQYAEFYDADAMETAAWLNGAEWARDPEDREPACACGDMDLCSCGGAMCCEVGRQDCGDDTRMHCAGGCWTNCRTCVADRKDGTR